jgi:hypothetical protein
MTESKGAAPKAAADKDDKTAQAPSQAAPLQPAAADEHTQSSAAGNPDESTNPVTAGAGVRHYPGENHVSLVDDESGAEVDAEDVFDDVDSNDPYVYTKVRVNERHTARGSSRPSERLVFAKGVRVLRSTARQFVLGAQAQAQAVKDGAAGTQAAKSREQADKGK